MKKLLLLLLLGTMAYAQPAINQPDDLTACEANYDGHAFFDLTVNNAVMVDNPALYTITYHHTQASAEYGLNAMPNPENYYSVNSTVYASVIETANPSSHSVAAIALTVMPKPPVPETPDITIYDNNAAEIGFTTIDLTIYNDDILGSNPNVVISFHETPNDAAMGVNAIPNPESYINITPYSQTLYVRVVSTVTSCYSTGSLTVTIQSEPFLPPPPTGEAEQTFTQGDTLADLEVEGENIQWYETSEGDTPLNMSTILVDGTTYFAAQTINNTESNNRLGVTVHLTAGIADNTFSSLHYYPNPAASSLNIENINGIDAISVTNTLGQKIFTQAINSNSAQIDVSSLNKGVYFVTVTSGSASKILKIIKE
ncbi:T9SS type A sorting domain-containing protein [Flavobacterium hauense]